MHCVVGEWGGWGECDKSCGVGLHTRTRRITQPLHGGDACPAATDTGTCSYSTCPIACNVTVWSTWGECSEPCGPGVHSRHRTVLSSAKYGGQECPPLSDLEETRDCEVQICPVHCIFNWLPWSECTKTCDGGTQARSFVITVHNNTLGRACPAENQDRVCNEHACPTPRPTPMPTPPTSAPTTAPSPRPFSKPTLNVLDGDILEIEATHEDNYVDAGAECSDSIDGDLSREVRVSGDVVDLGVPGRYEIRYSCVNSGEVQAEIARRTVQVRDTICPVCTLNDGPSEVEASFPYHDAGVTCFDTLDGPLAAEAVQMSSDVNVERVGTYTVTYRVHDKALNWNTGLSTSINVPSKMCRKAASPTTYTRKIKVVDTLKPVLALTLEDRIVTTSAANDRSTAKGAAWYGFDHENPARDHNFSPEILMAKTETPSNSGTIWFASALLASLAGAALLLKVQRRPRWVRSEDLPL